MREQQKGVANRVIEKQNEKQSEHEGPEESSLASRSRGVTHSVLNAILMREKGNKRSP